MSGIQKAIDLAGGQMRLAEMLGVNYQRIQYWRRAGVPGRWCKKIEQALRGKVKRRELNPDVFGD